MRAAVNAELHRYLLPRSRAEVSELIDLLAPKSFHRLVFTRQRPPVVPWLDARKLRAFRPMTTRLFKSRLPARRGAWRSLRRVKFTSSSRNTVIELQVPEWKMEILRRSDGQRSLAEILAAVSPCAPARQLREGLYLLHQLAVMELLPPKAVR